MHNQPSLANSKPINAFRAMAIAALVLLSGCATQTFDLQGHRGARGLAPENTLAAFERALDVGVATLEMDIGLTKDGVVVVYHDRTLNPDITRDASGAFLTLRGAEIASLTLAELQRFDVGRIDVNSNYGKPFASQSPRDGERIPTLASVFALANKRDAANIRFNIETKLSPLIPEETASPDRMVSALIEEIRRAGFEKRATIQSFDWRTLRIAQTKAPEIATVYLTNQQGANETVQIGKPGASPWLGGFDIDDYGGSIPKLVKAAGGAVWSPNFRDVTEPLVRETQALGLKLIPWTVNDVADMKRLIEWKVDGIITDYPDRLREVMKSAGMALPQSFAIR
jgi:glycerophosphoryl diester phosphodiesterase